ncbi:MAG: FkbM family methyltransferase [Gemmatimonadetes bacterium]|nr:FkbM family methyltransferase [Gemmatimonadota bacterium]
MKPIPPFLARLPDRFRRNGLVRGFRAPYLARICRPATVFDVGVGRGTDELYRAFPEARVLLIEPLAEYRQALERISRKYDCRIIDKAVGSRCGQAEIAVDTGDPHKSSFGRRTGPGAPGGSLASRTVEMTTLDRILREHPDLEPPFLLKIDTEGHELEVVEGADELLRRTEVVIAEVSVAERFEEGYRFEEFVAAMGARGFRVFDFLRVRYLKKAPGTRFADIVFKKADAG